MCLMGKEAACCCLLAPDFLPLFKTGCFWKSAFRDVRSFGKKESALAARWAPARQGRGEPSGGEPFPGDVSRQKRGQLEPLTVSN